MEGPIVVFQQITTHFPILYTHLDEIKQTPHHISNFGHGFDVFFDEVEGYVHSCDAQVTSILKTSMKHKDLIVGKNSQLDENFRRKECGRFCYATILCNGEHHYL